MSADRSAHYAALVREACVEAALADEHKQPRLSRDQAVQVAQAELLWLLVEMENPTVAGIAERRSVALRIVGELMRHAPAQSGMAT